MSTIKVYALGGLDKKSNDLTRATDKASDMINMEYDTQSTIKKRNGFVLSVNAPADDIIYYASRDEYLTFKLNTTGTPGVYALVVKSYVSGFGSFRYVSIPSGILINFPSSTSVYVSYCEIGYNLYFTLDSGVIQVMCYDGSQLRSAGLQVPYNTYDTNKKIINFGANGVYQAAAGTSYYIRTFFKYTDYNGNIIYGPYIQSTQKYNNGSTITIQPPNYSNISFQAGVTNVVLNQANPTIQNGVGGVTGLIFSNFQPGDRILFINNSTKASIDAPANRLFVQLEVLSKSTTPGAESITFTSASLANVQITFQASTFHFFYRQIEVCIAISQSQSTGYYFTQNSLRPWDNANWFFPTASLTPQTFTLDDTGFSAGTLVPLENLYTSSTLKIQPPVCKYIAAFGSQMVFANITGTYDLNNNFVVYNNSDLIIYSDVLNGDGPENISDLNRQKIGETYDGQITGLMRCNDSMIIFKKRAIFSIDGTLIQGQYSLRKINTNEVGCTFFKSIVTSDEGLYFQGHNGIYFTNAISVNKLSYELDYLFLSSDYSGVRAARFKKKQKTAFYIPALSSIVIIDYYYNQIYIWNGFTPSGGFITDQLGNVLFSDGTNIYTFSDSGYSDNGVAITSSYSSTWHHAGDPALNKKFLSLRMWGLTIDAFTATVTTQGDWDTSTNLTTNQLVFSSTDQTKFVMLDMKTKKSLRVTFSNANNNENMAITGYELTYEPFNVVDKN